MCDISIIVAVYNHERYIEKAIRSIMMQHTSFSYEVLIGEDCSTDSSRQVLEGLEKEMPSNFIFLYRESNYGARKNFNDLYQRMNGRYFIVLEGDDYWTYDQKLQKECEFLENHPEYIAVAHNTEVVDKNGKTISFHYPECHRENYDIHEFARGILPGQTTTILCRNFYKYSLFDYQLDVQDTQPGDRVRAFLLAANGKTYCFQEMWSAYRYVPYSGSSFTANHEDRKGNILSFHRFLFSYVKNHDVSKAVFYTVRNMYAWSLFRGFLREKDTLEPDEWEIFWKQVKKPWIVYTYIAYKLLRQPLDKMIFLNQIRESQREKKKIIEEHQIH